jgi:membrane associated rhomboid family serine protease
MSERSDDTPAGAEVLPVPGGERSRADEWALVLASQGVRCRVGPHDGGYALHIATAERHYAETVLDEYLRENPSGDDPESTPAAEPLGEPGISGVVAAFVLIGLHLGFSGRPELYAAGSADATRIASGEWWRSVTALCLHADLGHVIGNSLFGAYFVTAVSRTLGGGLAIGLIMLTGAVGNLLNASLQGPGHISVGASTAVFGAIGMLSGLALARRRRMGLHGRRLWVPLAAALGLLAMLGVSGARVDVGAHLFGLLVGGVLGAASAPLAARRPRLLVQIAAGLATGILIAQCWALALGR